AATRLWVGSLTYYYDPETGRIWILYRPFEPLIGRWAAVDPLDRRLGRTKRAVLQYIYCENTPAQTTDPSGLLSTRLLPPIVQNCGFVCLPIQWTLSPTEVDGFIIQKISMKVLVKHCTLARYWFFPKCSQAAGLIEDVNANRSATLQYYELWPVKG